MADIILQDEKTASSPICPTVGCAQGTEYTYCD